MLELGQTGGALIGNVILDATLSELHRKTNRPTDHPIEEGANVTDHIQQQPEELELTGLVSDFPVYWLAGFTAPSPLTDEVTRGLKNRAKKAHVELARIMDSGELVDVVTTFRAYYDMAITSLTVPKDAGSGNEARVSISLRQIVKVETKEVAAPVPESSAAAPPVDTGKKTPKEAPEETEQKSSFLGSAFSAATGT